MLKSSHAHMIAYYPFERGSDDAFGSAALNGNAFDIGHCLETDGATEYALVSDHSDLDFSTVFSAGVWFRRNGTPSANEALLSKWDSGASKASHMIMLDIAGRFYARVSDDGTTNAGHFLASYYAVNLCDDFWHHLVYVWSSGTITQYVDGSVISPIQAGTIGTSAYSSDVDVMVAGRHNSGALELPYAGRLAGAALFNAALSAAEVEAWYNLGVQTDLRKHSKVSNLKLFLPLGYRGDDFTASTGSLQDLSGNSHDATPYATDSSNKVSDNPGPLYANNNGEMGGGYEWDVGHAPITIEDNAAIQNIFATGGTVCWRMNPQSDGENNFGRVLRKQPAATEGWDIFVADELAGSMKLGFLIYFDDSASDYGYWRTTSADVQVGAWHHVALVYDASDVANDPTIYVDGVAVNVTEIKAPVGAVEDDSGIALLIGNRLGGTEPLTASFDDAQIYTAMLSAQNVNRIRMGMHPLPTTDFA